MGEADQCYIDAALAVAPRFELEPSSVWVLSRSENVVCGMQMPDGSRRVMRFHRPGYSSIAELNSEVQWVQALQASGLPVPTAVPTGSNDHYLPVDIGGESTQVGVVEWIDGEPLGSPTGANAGIRPDDYTVIGQVAAKIRQHAAQWEPPAGFVRRRWDCDGFVGDDPVWGRFWEADGLSGAQQDLFLRTRTRLIDVLGELSTKPDRFGLIHADLHLGNVMSDGDNLTIIDFDDAGFGWFAHELAVALHTVMSEPDFPDFRAAMLDGYRSVHPFDDDEAQLLDTFITVRCLMFVGWLDSRRSLPIYDEFTNMAAQAEQACERFLSG